MYISVYVVSPRTEGLASSMSASLLSLTRSAALTAHGRLSPSRPPRQDKTRQGKARQAPEQNISNPRLESKGAERAADGSRYRSALSDLGNIFQDTQLPKFCLAVCPQNCRCPAIIFDADNELLFSRDSPAPAPTTFASFFSWCYFLQIANARSHAVRDVVARRRLADIDSSDQGFSGVEGVSGGGSGGPSVGDWDRRSGSPPSR